MSFVFVPKGICNALSLDIKASSKVRAFVGEKVQLMCTFKSSSPITESLTVDWTYRPLTGGQMETVSEGGNLFVLKIDQVSVHVENLMVSFPRLPCCAYSSL